MKWRIQNQFVANYLLMFIISIIIGILALTLMDFANDVISKTLVKNNYTAESLMQDDYYNIDTAPVVENGGGIQVISNDYEVVLTAGLNTFTRERLTVEEFTDFLTSSQRINVPYSYDIAYNPQGKFWLIVTFPTSLRIDFAIVHNEEYASADMQNVAGAFVAIALFYLLLLALSTVIYSKLTSMGIVSPLKQLTLSARRLREGDYSSRVDLNLNNEFAELQDTFNSMAEQIEKEISLRKQSEENRKQLVLDISHDLKNPLASIRGYAEYYRNNPHLSIEERDNCLKIIHENSIRADNLITDLFELSKMESSEFLIHNNKIDICEYIREEMGKAIPLLDEAGMTYEFEVPEKEIFVMLDVYQMSRVIQNLVANTIHYNPEGTKVSVIVIELDDEVQIIFKDDGIGIPSELADKIFNPFVRVDSSRSSDTGGTGLGLAIVAKIIQAHGGTIALRTERDSGCEFLMSLPKYNKSI